MLSDGSAGTSYGRFLQITMIQVHADVRQPVGSRITRITLTDTGEDIDLTDDTREYRVAVPSKYIRSFAVADGLADFDGYWSIFDQGTNQVDTGIYIYDALVELIQFLSPLSIYWDPVDCSDPNNPLVITHD